MTLRHFRIYEAENHIANQQSSRLEKSHRSGVLLKEKR
jgi:hypothetical protein